MSREMADRDRARDGQDLGAAQAVEIEMNPTAFCKHPLL